MNTKLQILGNNITQQENQIQNLDNKTFQQNNQIQNLDNKFAKQDNQIRNLDNKNSQQDAQIQSLKDKLKKIETQLHGKSKQTIPPEHGQKSRTQLIFYSIRNLQIRLNLTSSASCFTS